MSKHARGVFMPTVHGSYTTISQSLSGPRYFSPDVPLAVVWCYERCALVCLSQICEQSTFSLERTVTAANLLIAGQVHMVSDVGTELRIVRKYCSAQTSCAIHVQTNLGPRDSVDVSRR